MTSEADFAETARRLKEMSDRMMAPSRKLQDLSATLVRQSEMLKRPTVISGDWIKKTQQLAVSITPVWEISTMKLAAEQARIATEGLRLMTPKISGLLASYPAIAQGFAAPESLNAASMRIAEMAQSDALRRAHVERLVGPLRESAIEAAEELQSSDVDRLIEAVDEVKQAIEDLPHKTQRDPTVIVAMYLGLLFTFLANPQGIIEAGFETAAGIGQALGRVWEYALIVLIALILRSRPDAS